MLKLALVASIACQRLLVPVTADTSDIKPVDLGRWIKVCRDDQTRCLLTSEFLSEEDAGRIWARLYVARFRGGFKLLVETPRLAREEIEVEIDGINSGLIAHPVCSNEGCDFVLTFDRANANVLENARTGAVSMSVRPNENVRFSFDLKSLGPALSALPLDPQ